MKLFLFLNQQIKKWSQTGSRRQRVVSASAWNLGHQVVTNLLRLGSSLVMTRLLAPEMYGVMALVWTFITALEMFSDTGLRAFMIRREKLDSDRLLDTVFSIQVMRGVFLWFLTFIIAGPIANFYQQPVIEIVLPFAGLSILLRGFVSPAMIVAEKQLEYKKYVLVMFGAYLFSLAVMISWAFVSPSVWALAGSAVANGLVMAIFSHILFREKKIWFGWNKEVALESFHFGKWVFASTILTFIVNQADKIIIGKYFSIEELGVYSIALLFYLSFRQVVDVFYGKIFFPVLAEVQNTEQTNLLAKYYHVRRTTDWLFVMGGMVLLVSGDSFISLLYDTRYHAAGGMLNALMISGIILSAVLAMQTLTVTLGEPRYNVWANFLRLLWVIIALPFLVTSFGIMGVAYAIGLLEAPPLLYWITLMIKKGYFSWRQEFKIIYPILVGFVLGLGCENVIEILL